METVQEGGRGTRRKGNQDEGEPGGRGTRRKGNQEEGYSRGFNGTDLAQERRKSKEEEGGRKMKRQS